MLSSYYKFWAFMVMVFLSVSACRQEPGQDMDKPAATAEKTQPDRNFKQVQVAEYALMLPRFLNEQIGLNEEASLQYGNPVKEFYVTVLDENIEDIVAAFKDAGIYDSSLSPLKNYALVQMDNWEDQVAGMQQPALANETINGREAYVQSLSIREPDIKQKVFYLFGFIASNDKVYMITCWTLDAKKEKYKSQMEDIIQSFKIN